MAYFKAYNYSDHRACGLGSAREPRLVKARKLEPSEMRAFCNPYAEPRTDEILQIDAGRSSEFFNLFLMVGLGE